MKLIRILSVTLVALSTFVTINLNVASAAGTYKISCKNNAYGMQLGSDYTQVAYVYNTSGGVVDGAAGLNQSYLLGSFTDHEGAYVGNDCIYAGTADTNGTAVVAADVARLAIDAIVGAVSNRIDMAYAANNSAASATGLSFTTQADGIAMSANKIVGGLSFWADYGTTDFKNTQTFTSVRLDSMKYDGDASSYSLGIDKVFGKALFGLVVSNLDADLKTTFNDGTYKQEVDTMGVYIAYRSGPLQIDLGMGSGDSKITTTRRDLGNDLVINGTTDADISYGNARIAAEFVRGRFSITPHASYRTMTMDIDGFTDDRADDISANVTAANSTLLFSAAGNETLGVTDDIIAARSVETKTTDIGLKLAATLGKITPYIDVAYASEDTTAAAYKAEVGTDGNDKELAASNYSSSLKMSGGINFMLGSHVKGGIRAGQINGRDDWNESYVAGSISVGF